MRARPGSPAPLGATWNGTGVNFALASAHARHVDLCLFDRASDRAERLRVALAHEGAVWHVFVPDLGPGQLYGYRVDGPWDPSSGHRFNPSKVLLDPYARVIGRVATDHPALFGSTEGSGSHGPPELTDSAPYAPLAAVAGSGFDWRADRRPHTPWTDTVVYEVHVKGFTALHPDIPAAHRGAYLGLAAPAAIAHLQSLGVTAVELLPVQAHADEWQLARSGRTNYWGYNTLGFFAPDPRFLTSASPLHAIVEFKTMVHALHAAGIEVILDVVYNHTAEGDHFGPHLSMRGIDNARYYRLDPNDRARYQNYSGTGNTLDLRSDVVLRLVLDSLRYWIEEMHVDGFRFDLASALVRGDVEVDPSAAFFRAVQDDPIISTVKLIAEPWDASPDGFHVGRFPPGWTEWNAHYRDTVRRFWRGDAGQTPALATRLAGSSDLYARAGRTPQASLNYITAHDGFTLADLVAYKERHNLANGENNRDGEANNFSWNSGTEGPTDDPATTAVRRRQQRNLLLTLFTSLGVPMISGGDEIGRTQAGNNNAYCHDSPLTWTPWTVDDDAAALLAFVRRLGALRATAPALRRASFLAGRKVDPPDALWLRAEGGEMSDQDWADPGRRTLGWLLSGPDAADDLLILLHAGDDDVAFVLPRRADPTWEVLLDTAAADGVPRVVAAEGDVHRLMARSAVVLRAGTVTRT